MAGSISRTLARIKADVRAFVADEQIERGWAILRGHLSFFRLGPGNCLPLPRYDAEDDPVMTLPRHWTRGRKMIVIMQGGR